MSDIQKPHSPSTSETGIKRDDEEFESSQDFSSSQISQNTTGPLKDNDETPLKMNGLENGHHDLNGHVSDEEEEFEIDIDPRMDMMMLEPQVDIIEDPTDFPPPSAPHEPSIFRRKRAKPQNVKGQRGNNVESPKPKRRLVSEDTVNVDDRVGCRSLVCDSNGIIIAEMVFRCMICAHISDAISTARLHYQSVHMSRQPSGIRNGAFSRSIAQDYDSDYDEQDEFDNDLEIEACRSRHNFHNLTNQNVQNDVPLNSRNLENNSSSFSSEDPLDPANMDLSTLKKPGNFVTAPIPNSYVPGRNTKTNRKCFKLFIRLE